MLGEGSLENFGASRHSQTKVLLEHLGLSDDGHDYSMAEWQDQIMDEDLSKSWQGQQEAEDWQGQQQEEDWQGQQAEDWQGQQAEEDWQGQQEGQQAEEDWQGQQEEEAEDLQQLMI